MQQRMIIVPTCIYIIAIDIFCVVRIIFALLTINIIISDSYRFKEEKG